MSIHPKSSKGGSDISKIAATWKYDLLDATSILICTQPF